MGRKPVRLVGISPVMICSSGGQRPGAKGWVRLQRIFHSGWLLQCKLAVQQVQALLRSDT